MPLSTAEIESALAAADGDAVRAMAMLSLAVPAEVLASAPPPGYWRKGGKDRVEQGRLERKQDRVEQSRQDHERRAAGARQQRHQQGRADLAVRLSEMGLNRGRTEDASQIAYAIRHINDLLGDRTLAGDFGEYGNYLVQTALDPRIPIAERADKFWQFAEWLEEEQGLE